MKNSCHFAEKKYLTLHYTIEMQLKHRDTKITKLNLYQKKPLHTNALD